ncbi:thioredoxin reductase [Metarhizium brunneum]
MGQSCITEDFVASLAQLLNTAQVPCVLWGHVLLRIHGVPTIVGAVDFVVPDELLSVATQALTPHEKLMPCPDGKDCDIISPSRPTPAPESHLHIEGAEEPVGLYPQSATLWFLPPLQAALTTPDRGQLPPCYALASDKSILPPYRLGRGSGFFKSTTHPVVIVPSHVLLEAFMRFCARYVNTPAGGFSISMIAYVGLYIHDDGYLDLKQLSEPLSSSYLALIEGKIPVRQWVNELKKLLGEPGLLT